MKYDDQQEVVKIHMMHESKSDTYHPAVEITNTHETTPIWVASVLYLLLDRYLSGIEESDQTDFLNQTLKVFDYLLKDQQGSTYINTLFLDDKD